MINGIGIDSTEINRFANWHSMPIAQLKRIFSPAEIEYSLESPPLSPQRFAVRFAAKEAFFKAWNSALPTHYAPFLTFCRAVSLTHGAHNAPKLEIHYNLLPLINRTIHPLISLTHTQTTATAFVFLQIHSI